jgi:hypothetical protein
MNIRPADRGMLLSTMSDASVASMLGRSAGWVAKARAHLAEAAAADQAAWSRAGGEIRQDPSKSAEPVSEPAPADRNKGEEGQPDAPPPTDRPAAGPEPEPPCAAAAPVVAAQPVAGDAADPGDGRDAQGPADLDEPPQIDLEEVIAAKAPEPAGPFRLRAGLAAVEPEPRAEIPARVLRWAGWFLDASWPLKEVARLFDVAPDDLLDARKYAGRRAA